MRVFQGLICLITLLVVHGWSGLGAKLKRFVCVVGIASSLGSGNALADEAIDTSSAVVNTVSDKENIDFGAFKLPYNHENLSFKQFIGNKATIVFNMKIDDSQTVLQFPSLLEIYNKYSKDGLNVLAFPTEQGWFEPDDDETIRAKGIEYYGFGDYPHAVVFDKIDLLGPSAHPLYTALTKALPTPNGYGRITLNYEKFLLDSTGQPVRRYPRKFSAYDMEADIKALLNGEALPAESPAYQKAWREAKREAVKSEYAFRLNYNYYNSPDSMYKYNSAKDKVEL
jgi:glutathione peroxidase